jgi:starch synthase (maltosyl-transferring)
MGAVQDLRADTLTRVAIAGRKRVAIEDVQPQVDSGRFPIKRVAGEKVIVEANVFADGHDHVACQLLYRFHHESDWTRVDMHPIGNDRWRAEFPVSSVGRYFYAIEGWIDHLETWRADLLKRIAAGQDVHVDLLIGAGFIEEASRRAGQTDAEILRHWARRLRSDASLEERKAIATREDLLALARRYPDLLAATRSEPELTVTVDRERAAFSTWYELFPRSASPDPHRHGTFHDCEQWLPYVASMGFDVLYFPPVHPIGHTFRKGRNNATVIQDGDIGSPWAIGSRQGGHKSVHPDLGTLADFRALLAKAKDYGIELALDLAFQCSADHPYVRHHPEWFRLRPDGSIQYAENPPKKYQDIYPFDFETEHWQELWDELRSVVEFWIDQGVRIFRVDNPHTKPFNFWQWLIAAIKDRHPEVLFLAEAFTRPKVMQRLAKLGFSQSYTYFAWRNTKQELTDYFEELTQTPLAEYFRSNLWPNTPDILTAFLQTGGRSAFIIRLILAATLGANYGIYGPAFELAEAKPREPGSEEYLDSEKYEVRHWNINSPTSLRSLIARVNTIRRENTALQSDRTLRFHTTDNPEVICYSKTTDDNTIVVLVNLDPFHRQVGFVTLDLNSLHLNDNHPFEALDLLSGEAYTWNGSRNYFELIPAVKPAHILRIQQRSA